MQYDIYSISHVDEEMPILFYKNQTNRKGFSCQKVIHEVSEGS